jgi:aspartate racemase
MRTLGIVGGIGPESTIEYYRAILDAVRHRHGETTAPPILINSIDVHKVLRLAGAGDLGALASYLEQELARLVRAGADAAIMAANTPHAVFDDLVSRCSIPLISIVEATASVARAQGLGRLGLLGTRSTMEGQFFPDVFAKYGMTIVAPNSSERAYVHEKYTTELVHNVFSPETRLGMCRLIEMMKGRDRIDGVILGGTELPLLLRDRTYAGIPLLDTTSIHAAAAVDHLWPAAS